MRSAFCGLLLRYFRTFVNLVLIAVNAVSLLRSTASLLQDSKILQFTLDICSTKLYVTVRKFGADSSQCGQPSVVYCFATSGQ
ncbi:hypothetical protein J6590_030952 [Homalodisca vitripennis]|nr:hypothetical protein J6590_030952 [Homalodisca vitripennis]